MDKKKAGKIAAAVVGMMALTGCVWMGAKLTDSVVKENTQKTETQFTLDASKEKIATGKQMSKVTKDAVTVHFYWTGAQPHMSYKVSSTGKQSTYPGIPMKDEGNGWYSCTIANAPK